jgi:hypothetical protein
MEESSGRKWTNKARKERAGEQNGEDRRGRAIPNQVSSSISEIRQLRPSPQPLLFSH